MAIACHPLHSQFITSVVIKNKLFLKTFLSPHLVKLIENNVYVALDPEAQHGFGKYATSLKQLKEVFAVKIDGTSMEQLHWTKSKMDLISVDNLRREWNKFCQNVSVVWHYARNRIDERRLACFIDSNSNIIWMDANVSIANNIIPTDAEDLVRPYSRSRGLSYIEDGFLSDGESPVAPEFLLPNNKDKVKRDV